jgi:pyridoxine 5-phosphate synthase
MIRLGVNIDHVATLREARGETFPDPIEAAQAAIKGGAQGITAHLREDRRHIKDHDLLRLKRSINVPLNMEMAATPEIISVATRITPAWTCLVPERRAELTTEGGLDLKRIYKNLKEAIIQLHNSGIKVSLFVDARLEDMKRARELGADAVEIHTGPYARLSSGKDVVKELGVTNSALAREHRRILECAQLAKNLQLTVNAGHGLDYSNTGALAQSFPFHEFNIGFAIVSKAVFVGLEEAVRSMKSILEGAACVES